MSERLDRLLREIEAEKALALQEAGLSFNGPVLVCGNVKLDQVIADRLQSIPKMLHQEAESQMRRNAVVLPWLTHRKVAANHLSVELESKDRQ